MKSTMFTLLMLFTLSALAQFGYKSKKELEAVKKTELIVVLTDDTADQYNKSIRNMMNQHWKHTAVKYMNTQQAAEYSKKGDGFTYLVLVKCAGARLKSKAMSSEVETTGLLMTSKFKKGKIMLPDILASALFDSKFGPTAADYDAQCLRAVQFLNNFFAMVPEAANDKELDFENMQKRYPGDKSLADGKKLLIDKKLVPDEKQKMLIEKNYPGEVVFTDAPEITKAILAQDKDVIYFAAPAFELDTHLMFVTANGSKILWYELTRGGTGYITGREVQRLVKN